MFIRLFLITTIILFPCITKPKKNKSSISALSTPKDENKEAIKTALNINQTITPSTEPIIITNAINAKEIDYKHWTGTYTPDLFTIHVNGTEVAQGAQHSLPAETKNVDVMFTYSFMKGMRKGTKTVSYKLHDNVTEAKITFTWKDDWQVLVDNATAVSKSST